MTTKERLIKIIMNYGVSVEHAEEILILTLPVLNYLTDINVSLDSHEDNYSKQIFTMWNNVVIKPIVYKWVQNNKKFEWNKTTVTSKSN